MENFHLSNIIAAKEEECIGGKAQTKQHNAARGSQWDREKEKKEAECEEKRWNGKSFAAIRKMAQKSKER